MTGADTGIATDPLAATRFEEPWHAQVFALTVALSEAGRFTWPEWTEAFGATLARHGKDRALDGGEDYFHAWLETLEALLARLGLAEPAVVEALRDAWEAAYLATPHGQPVHLKD
ncbi:nitrile hydratase accessory protein [Acidimangrovimonas sediminis]|uniref:nitrile hydratase accessory protein n=1 Tax=Acidimangrovimonas sediminis TaxID=2056283 RepID=UPI000C80DB51|nr:nitrile hydratase accessory protein [Acidimangrovimonas sediminis]